MLVPPRLLGGMYRQGLALSLALLASGSWLAGVQGASPKEHTDVAQIQALIAQLGSPKFSARKAASEKLAQIGLPAFSALEEAARHTDREVRYRAEKVLAIVRQNDLERRLAEFLAASDTPSPASLPAWSRFQKAFGNTAASRELFVQMQRADSELLAAFDMDVRKGVEVLSQRTLTYQQAQQAKALQNGLLVPLSLGEITALLFVAGEEDVRLSSQTVMAVLTFCNQPGFREAMLKTQTRELPSRLLGRVIQRSEDAAAYQAMRLATEYDLKEGLAPALKMLEVPNLKSRFYLQYALLLIVKYGDASHLPRIELLLDDKTQLGTATQDGVRREIQIRDSALAAGVLLTKQEIKDYFTIPMPTRTNQQGVSPAAYSLLQLGFENDEVRAAAQQKFLASQPRQKLLQKK